VTGISDRLGLLFLMVTNSGFSAVMGVINNFPPQKAVFIRDQQSGAYSTALFYITMTIAELPLQILAVLIQAVIVYWMSGLVREADNFFLFYAILLALNQVGVGIGYTISAAFDSYIVASAVTPMIIIPLMLCAGLLASTDRLRPYWYWLEKPSYLRAAFVLMMKNEFDDLGSISCDVEKFGAQFCMRQPHDGPQVLEAYGFADEHSAIWLQWVILAVIFVVTRATCLLFLYKIAKQKS
jgi:hypothetical protein